MSFKLMGQWRADGLGQQCLTVLNEEQEWPMRRNVSHQQKTDSADEALRALVRLLARVAAREALAATPQANEKLQSSLPSEGDDHAE